MKKVWIILYNIPYFYKDKKKIWIAPDFFLFLEK
jgi:hypothetical protein